MENNPIKDSKYHGSDGPLQVSNVPTPHPITRAFIDSSVEIGIPLIQMLMVKTRRCWP